MTPPPTPVVISQDGGQWTARGGEERRRHCRQRQRRLDKGLKGVQCHRPPDHWRCLTFKCSRAPDLVDEVRSGGEEHQGLPDEDWSGTGEQGEGAEITSKTMARSAETRNRSGASIRRVPTTRSAEVTGFQTGDNRCPFRWWRSTRSGVHIHL